jgi:uncharacterized protein
MRTLFADSAFFVACFVPDEKYHRWATDFMRQSHDHMITTSLVLAEFGNHLARSKARSDVGPFLRGLTADSRFQIVHPDGRLFDQGVELYGQRGDKNWGLTDCISFVLMRERDLVEAITTDHHFEQAGFIILMR